MRQFRQRTGTKSVVCRLEKTFTDIMLFDTVVQSLILRNPLGCTSYRTVKRNHPPLEVIREMYTAKFVYTDPGGKQIGIGVDRYNSVEGYETGIAAVISNMANIASHRGKVKHLPDADLFSVLMKCHDPEGELYFLSLARNRVTLSSYTDDSIRKRVEKWTDTVRALI
jgi:hypothetical protein